MKRWSVLVVSIGSMFLVACAESKKYEPLIRTVFVAEVTQANQYSSRTLSGVFQAADQSVLSFEKPGVINTINVNLGDSINEGEVLATLESNIFELAIQRSKGELSEVHARLKEAQLDFKRKSVLVESGSLSKSELDLAQARYTSLKDQVNIAETQLKLALEDLDDTQLIAPFDGRVAERHIEPSQQIALGNPALTIQGSDALEVALAVPESMITSITVGQKVLVNAVSQNNTEQLEGVVFERGNQAQAANAFPVTISIINLPTPDTIKPGMSAEVTFKLVNESYPQDALSVPISAVGALADNQHFVYRLNQTVEQTVLERVIIKALSFEEERVIFLSEERLDSVVMNGVDFLSDGQIVKVADAYPITINQ